ncbi:Oidioi.mRNA.OKI2018_I69.chr1.g3757.t1.cds [Oikopleura dioica]|uniref:Oidioi.mRNA.OKI2018_I69.chr1.g3757.t1.cds n=1 Tax=Oikopleura dioica TaxID=34765 RepID=A0ABN7SV54_OIKDI|nr:Oidioi.mRNA.OKI2018_I69.chr1.g3757.t1.cds [Oikopleura dioica]
MDLEEKPENTNFDKLSQIQIQCLDCKCFGTLRKIGDQVVLFTEESVNNGSGIVADNTVYIFPGNSHSVRGIQRIQIDEDETIVSVDIVGFHENSYYRPILFLTPINYCDA